MMMGLAFKLLPRTVLVPAVRALVPRVWNAGLIFAVAVLLAGCAGNHQYTQTYPICNGNGMMVRAIVSDSYYQDQAIELYLHGRRIGKLFITNNDDWAQIEAAIRKGNTQ